MTLEFRSHYDWLVLGDHPAGLFSLALLSSMGKSCLWLPLDEKPLGSFYSKSGQCFDPESSYQLGISNSSRYPGVLSQTLSDLNYSFEKRFHPDGALQVLTNRLRIDCDLNTLEFLKVLEQELGEEGLSQLELASAIEQVEPFIHSFWKSYPEKFLAQKHKPKSSIKLYEDAFFSEFYSSKNGIKSWASNKNKVSHLNDDLKGSYGDFLTGVFNGVTQLHDQDPRLFELLHLLCLSKTGGILRGGMTRFRAFLKQVAIDHGATILDQASCRRVFVDHQKLIGVQVAGLGKMISVNHGLLSGPIQKLIDLFHFSGKSDLSLVKKPLKPQGVKLTLALTVKTHGVSPGVKRRLIWKEKNAPAIEFEFADPIDYYYKQKGLKFLFIRSVVPFSHHSLNRESQRVFLLRMLKKTQDIFPFIGNHIVRIFPNVTKDQKTEVYNELKEAFPFSCLEQVPHQLCVYDEKGLGSETGIEGLSLASNESYPELSSLGGFVAVMEVLSQFTRKSKVLHSLSHRNTSEVFLND